MSIILQSLLVFVDLIAVDFCWARYTKNIADGNAVPAATWSMMIMLLGALAVISYMSNPILLLPAAAGAWVGTYIATKPDFFLSVRKFLFKG